MVKFQLSVLKSSGLILEGKKGKKEEKRQQKHVELKTVCIFSKSIIF